VKHGNFVWPTVFADVDNRMRIAQEEIFGPVACLIPFKDEADAIAKANDIVEYDGQRWIVSFDSENSPDNIQYVTNITTSIQYEWTGTVWIKSYQGLYPGGTWSLVL
jgi:acyl-CoA reductase-like NAD-dependent aldehyde dehydrogenase